MDTECKYYPHTTYKNPGCDLYMPGFCSMTSCYKIDKVSEADKKRRKFDNKSIEEESDVIMDSEDE